MIGRFILQVPTSTSRALAWIDEGLMPMMYRIQIKQTLFVYNIIKTKHNPTLLNILRELLEHPSDPFTKSWMKIQAQVGLIHNFTKKEHLQAAITHKAVAFVMGVKRQHSTLNTAPKPWKWFKIQDHVNDSKGSKYLCQVRGGNAQLGNRYKNGYMDLNMSFAHTAKHMGFI